MYKITYRPKSGFSPLVLTDDGFCSGDADPALFTEHQADTIVSAMHDLLLIETYMNAGYTRQTNNC